MLPRFGFVEKINSFSLTLVIFLEGMTTPVFRGGGRPPPSRLLVFSNILHINWGKIKQILLLSTEQFALIPIVPIVKP